jgi:hypothetical protein
MASSQKRRVKKKRPHQTMKSSASKSGPNWTRIAVIIIGAIIVLSMLLSPLALGSH